MKIRTSSQPEENPIVYSSEHFEENSFSDDELVLLEAYAVSVNSEPERPTLLLRDESKSFVLPVPLTPLETGISLAQMNVNSLGTSPHTLLAKLLESFSVQIERCVFVEIKGAHQFVRVYFEGHPQMGSMKFKAEEVMSAMLHLKVPIFATKKIISKSRMLSAEMQTLAQGLMLNPTMLGRHHPYLQ